MIPALLRLLLASLGMGGAVWFLVHRLVPYDFRWGFLVRAGWVAGVAALGAAAFVAFAALLRAPEVGETFGVLSEEGGTPVLDLQRAAI